MHGRAMLAGAPRARQPCNPQWVAAAQVHVAPAQAPAARAIRVGPWAGVFGVGGQGEIGGVGIGVTGQDRVGAGQRGPADRWLECDQEDGDSDSDSDSD